MGFFSKIFGRKSRPTAAATNSSPQKTRDTSTSPVKNSSRNRSNNNNRHKPALKPSSTLNTLRGDSPTDQLDLDPAVLPTIHHVPSPRKQQQLQQPVSPVAISKRLQQQSHQRGPDAGIGTQRVVPSPREGVGLDIINSNNSNNINNNKNSINSNNSSPVSPRRGGGPVDLDQSDVETIQSEADHVPSRLSMSELKKFELSQPQFTMENKQPLARFSAGQLALNIDDSRSQSDAESSSFNLSTDAEDTEYERLRHHGVMPHHLINQSLDTSNLSVASPYTTDGEMSVFPNLATDDEASRNELDDFPPKQMQLQLQQHHGNLPMIALAKNQKDNAGSPKSKWKKQQDDKGGKQDWKNESGGVLTTWKDKNDAWNGTSPSSSKSNDSAWQTQSAFPSSFTSSARRGPFTSPKRQDDAFAQAAFADFADFSQADFGFEEEKTSKNGSPVAEPNSDNKMPMVVSNLQAAAAISSSRPTTASTLRTASSTASQGPDTSLTDLLAQAKRKSRSSRTSVNSAPVTSMSAAALREHHGLRKPNGQRYGETGPSVSELIKDLEETVPTTRSKKPHRRGDSSDALSAAALSQGGVSTKSAKERLREKRRQREGRRQAGGGGDGGASSDSDENEWLFDEVTGALGPRGIAADLESLDGRSNRSHTSGGGRSHKSHRSHRSHKSHRSARRTSATRPKTSSGESVDSHGSKKSHGSRRSRSSRYSHRSTRSYMSQMSEQSRSVANDLLRLEMQLAMVGSNGEGEAVSATRPTSAAAAAAAASRRSSSSVGSSSNALTARQQQPATGTRRVASARRSRVTVMAPPGKLGIILANKADSKGTVVSGVRTTSVLAEKVSPGDRIVAIDGEDVSLMTVSEITTIMARKSDFERTLTVLTTPKHTEGSGSSSAAPRSGDYRYRN